MAGRHSFNASNRAHPGAADDFYKNGLTCRFIGSSGTSFVRVNLPPCAVGSLDFERGTRKVDRIGPTVKHGCRPHARQGLQQTGCGQHSHCLTGFPAVRQRRHHAWGAGLFSQDAAFRQAGQQPVGAGGLVKVIYICMTGQRILPAVFHHRVADTEALDLN